MAYQRNSMKESLRQMARDLGKSNEKFEKAWGEAEEIAHEDVGGWGEEVIGWFTEDLIWWNWWGERQNLLFQDRFPNQGDPRNDPVWQADRMLPMLTPFELRVQEEAASRIVTAAAATAAAAAAASRDAEEALAVAIARHEALLQQMTKTSRR